MRQGLHQGRPVPSGSKWGVIPVGWDEAHRPTVAGTMTVQTQLHHPNAVGGGWDDDLQEDTTATLQPYWTGLARVQQTRGMGARPVVADDPTSTSDYLVVVPADVEPEVGDFLTFPNVDDPTLTQSPLFITHITVGSLRFERDLWCSHAPRPPAAGGGSSF